MHGRDIVKTNCLGGNCIQQLCTACLTTWSVEKAIITDAKTSKNTMYYIFY